MWHVGGHGWPTPAFDSTAVYFSTMRHELVAISRTEGDVLWRAAIPYSATCFPPDWITRGFSAAVAGSSVAIAGALVIAAAGDAIAYALDRVDGHVVWRSPRQDLERVVVSHDGRIFIASVGGTTVTRGMPVVSLDTAGRELWRFTQPFSVFDIVADSRGVYFTPSASLIALDPANGREIGALAARPTGRVSLPPPTMAPTRSEGSDA